MAIDGRLDAALDRFARTGPEFGPGLSNHGPMASEALVALGRADAVEPWAEEYASRLVEHPRERNRIEDSDWREALGDVSRVGDWIAFFGRAITLDRWDALLELWVRRLSPGIMAGATHGVIRTAHAVRALTAGETPQRLHEFAEGLAYWAARYQELPTRSGAPIGLPVGEALARVQRIDDSQRGRFLIFEQVRALDADAFGPAINLVAPDEPDAFISEVTSHFVRQFIANASTSAIAFVHTVTAPAALRILAPHLAADTTHGALRYTWQACAAIYAAYGRVDPARLRTSFEVNEFDRGDVVEQAIATRDEHAIKFTEACFREYDVSGDGAFVHAAQQAARTLRA